MSRVALVTGGGTGIGAAIARRLAADGYAVAVTGRTARPIEEIAREIDGFSIVADVGVVADADRAVAVAGSGCCVWSSGVRLQPDTVAVAGFSRSRGCAL